MAVVVKTVLGSHFGVGAPPIWLWLSTPFWDPILAWVRHRYGCGCPNRFGIPFWGRCATVLAGCQSRFGIPFWGRCATNMAVVVKTVLGSHFGVGAPPIWLWLSKPFWDPILGQVRHRYGCGCQNGFEIPFWGRCATDMAVVVKTVLGSHFGVGAPPIWLWLSTPFWDPILAWVRHRYGCGCQDRFVIPFWGRCATDMAVVVQTVLGSHFGVGAPPIWLARHRFSCCPNRFGIPFWGSFATDMGIPFWGS